MTRRLLNCQRLLGMVVTMLCLLGIAAYSTMPRQEDPSFPYRAGLISINYPGASAEAVERLVLRPLVDELRQVEEVDYTQSTARTGVAIVRLRLNDDIYDTDPAWDPSGRTAITEPRPRMADPSTRLRIPRALPAPPSVRGRPCARCRPCPDDRHLRRARCGAGRLLDRRSVAA